MDKDLAKRLYRDAGVATPPWAMWPAGDEAIAALGLPLVVKPSKVGSTVGLTVVQRLVDVAAAVETALQYDDEVLLEQYLPGREFTVGILGEQALAVGEIIPSHAIFDYECKYTPGMTQEIFPAALDAVTTAQMQELALRAHNALKLRDFSRVDFRLDSDGVPHCMETNTLPGLTSASLLPQSAVAAGIPFAELCERICGMVQARASGRNKAAGLGM
jgi:D-alanine-D-alanine ligase